MNKLKNQKGLAALLFVILAGVSAMAVTVTVARTQDGKKESNVVANAQTSSQLVAWAGVNAFREYVLAAGANDIDVVKNLSGDMVLDLGGGKRVKVENIQVTGCGVVASSCLVNANITALNTAAKSATAINTVFDVSVVPGVAAPTTGKPISLGGSVSMQGSIEAKAPGSTVTINIDGDLKLDGMTEIKNISKLNINATGNIVIECGLATGLAKLCTSGTPVDLVAGGYIEINQDSALTVQNRGTFADLYAGNYIKLRRTTAQNVYAVGYVKIRQGTKTGDIYSGSYVDIDVDVVDVVVGNISANHDVKLKNAKAGDIKAGGVVEIYHDSQVGNIEAYGNVTLRQDLGATLSANNVYTQGNVSLYAGALFAKVTTSDIYANGSVSIKAILLSAKVITGHVYSGGSISRSGIGTKDSAGTHKNSNPSVSVLTTPTDVAAIQDHIDEQTEDLAQYVDVKAYLSEANYIFTKKSGYQHKRVYLNKLVNIATNESYTYQQGSGDISTGKQMINGVEASGPFYVAKYNYSGTEYIGAICQTVDANEKCTSDIVGFIPRVSVKKDSRAGLDTSSLGSFFQSLWNSLSGAVSNLVFGGSYNVFEYTDSKFIVSSMLKKSALDNANLSPGIMYFDDDLMIRGNGVSVATGTDGSAYTNSFLAEGKIYIALYSPNVYSPYNSVRDGNTVAAICDRNLKTQDNTVASNIQSSTPATLSTKYLRPTNLCSNASTFSKKMNKDSSGQVTSLVIDGVSVPKLDLGYVALMSNKIVDLMFCSHIYGDVLAKKGIKTSTDLICGGGERAQIEGAVVAQSGSDSSSHQWAKSKIIVPTDEQSNFGEGNVPTTPAPPRTNAVKVKWSKPL
ncbi:MAG: hypothetical protein WAO12_12060 [Venatoribacter sp.]